MDGKRLIKMSIKGVAIDTIRYGTTYFIVTARTKHMCRISSFTIFRSTNRPFIAPNCAVRSNHVGSSEINPLFNVFLPDRSTASPRKWMRYKCRDWFLNLLWMLRTFKATGFTKCKVQELKENMAYSLRHVSLNITTHLSLDIKILFYRKA